MTVLLQGGKAKMASKIEENEEVFKLVLVGDSGVGKTPIISRFMAGANEDAHSSASGESVCLLVAICRNLSAALAC